MRNPFLLAGTAVMAALFCYSCQKEISMEELEEVSEPTAEEVRTICFSVDPFEAEEGALESRSTYDANGNYYFSATDTVGIFPSKGGQVYFEIAGEDVGKQHVRFDGGGWALKDSHSYWSYSPVVGDFYLRKDHIPVKYFDLTQDGNESLNHISPVDFLYTGQCTVQDGSLSFSYHRLNCILRPRVTLPAGTYSKIVVKAESDVFVSKGYYDLTAGTPSIVGTEFTDHLTLNLKNVSFTEETAFVGNIMTAPVDISNMPIKVIIYCGDSPMFYYTYQRSTPLAANTPHGLRCDDLKCYDANQEYTKVSSITVGSTYLVVDVADKRLFKGNVDGSYVNISPENDVISDSGGAFAGYEFTVENSGNNYYLKFNDGKYLVCNYGGGNNNSGLHYVNSRSNVTYPFALTVGDNGAIFFSTSQMNSPSTKNQVLYYKPGTGSGADMFRIGGTGATIGAHFYIKEGKLSRCMGFNPDFVTMTIGVASEKPALSGVYSTVTYTSSDNSIATVDASGNVTPISAGIVTITATSEGDDQFNSGKASYTLRVLSPPREGWIDKGTVNLENTALNDYLDAANSSYSDTDEVTNSVMATYATGSAYSSIVRKDCPNPVTITWANCASTSTVISIYENQALTNPIWSQNATDRATSADVYNLVPGRTYYYTVSEDSIIWEKGHFNTAGRRRMIKVSDTGMGGYANNCRDLGGLEATDKGTEKTIKYGYIFRGSNMDMTTDAEKAILLGLLNVGMDLDLRKGVTSASDLTDEGSSYCYQPFQSPYNVGYINPGFDTFEDLTDNVKVKSVITTIFNTAKTGKATFLHCKVGADRTGYFCMLIEGLLGVSEKDCSIDYELTSFSDAAGLRYRTSEPVDYYYRQGLTFLRGQSGNTFQDKIENYLVGTVGILQADIDEFKGIILE